MNTPSTEALDTAIDQAFANHEAALDAKYGERKWHCDDIWANDGAPAPVLAYLNRARAPAYEQHLHPDVPLFATYQGQRVRVVMASRFGDVGVTTNLSATSGYGIRVYLPDLTDFSDTP
jgi:hypothetical protein